MRGLELAGLGALKHLHTWGISKNLERIFLKIKCPIMANILVTADETMAEKDMASWQLHLHSHPTLLDTSILAVTFTSVIFPLPGPCVV